MIAPLHQWYTEPGTTRRRCGHTCHDDCRLGFFVISILWITGVEPGELRQRHLGPWWHFVGLPHATVVWLLPARSIAQRPSPRVDLTRTISLLSTWFGLYGLLRHRVLNIGFAIIA